MSKILLMIITLFILCLFNFTLAKRCPIGEQANTAADCLPYNKPGHLCCYLSSEMPKLSVCLQLSKSAYNGLKKYSMGGVLYDIECKEEESNQHELIIPGSPCGVMEPTKPEDCKQFSNTRNSCCYFQSTFSAGCYNLGFSTTGKVSLLGMSLDC